MFSRRTLITSLDIGASAIKAVIAEVDNQGYAEILGHGRSPTSGLKDDVIKDIRELGEGIAASVDMAEEMASQRAGSLVVSIGGEHVRILRKRGGIEIKNGGKRGSRYINRQDIRKAVDSAGSVIVPAALHVMHVLPINFYVDGQKVKDPEGLSGTRLEADVMIVAARQSILSSIAKAAEYADCRVNNFCYRPLATGRAVISNLEMTQGSCLVDVGGRHTDVAVFKEGRLVFATTLALGGENITLDASSQLEIGRGEAEKIKLSYGHCTSTLSEDTEFQITGVRNGELWRTIKKSDLGFNVIQPRVEEIIEESLLSISDSGEQEDLPGGAVFTGGTSQMPGFTGLASAIFPFRVNSGVNVGFENMDEVSSRPEYATALGLVLLDNERRITRRKDVMDNPLSRLCNRFIDKIHTVM